jgi:hypothetical protein
VRQFLPQDGMPGPLAADAVDPTTTAAGVLAGQTLALTLSVGFHAADPSFGGSCLGLDSLVVVDSGSPCLGFSVGEVLAEANRVLAGVASAFSASEINTCVDRINQNFVDGKTDNGRLAIGAPLPGDFRTHDQVEWGQAAIEGSAGLYRDATFALAFPAGVSVGASALAIPGFSAHFTTALAVEAFLPQVGVAAPLTADATDPLLTDAGVLAGDSLALALNLGFDAFDPGFSASCVLLADLVVVDAASPCLGWSVQQVLDQANAILAGAPATVTPDEIDACVAAVNANFLGGLVEGGFLGHPNACAVHTPVALVEDVAVRVSFRRAGRDKFKLEGGMALPPRFEPQGQLASCDVGGARLDFTLDARGRGKLRHAAFKLRSPRRDGGWRYVCKGRRGDWGDEWADDGIVDADAAGTPVALPVEVRVGGFVRSGLAGLGYRAHEGRGGKATK